MDQETKERSWNKYIYAVVWTLVPSSGVVVFYRIPPQRQTRDAVYIPVNKSFYIHYLVYLLCIYVPL